MIKRGKEINPSLNFNRKNRSGKILREGTAYCSRSQQAPRRHILFLKELDSAIKTKLYLKLKVV